jgi:hypothetical protein
LTKKEKRGIIKAVKDQGEKMMEAPLKQISGLRPETNRDPQTHFPQSRNAGQGIIRPPGMSCILIHLR